MFKCECDSEPLDKLFPSCCLPAHFQFQIPILQIVSSVCINLCVHSISSTELHKSLHYSTWPTGSLSPVYFYEMSSSSVPNLICMSLLHCDQYFIPSLCATHHLVGVAFRKHQVLTYLLFRYLQFKLFTNMLISINPSYLGGSHNFVPIQCKDQFMCAHCLVDTSCILCYQFSRPAYESDASELILLQRSEPSIFGLT
jgi:hypothetical protein